MWRRLAPSAPLSFGPLQPTVLQPLHLFSLSSLSSHFVRPQTNKRTASIYLSRKSGDKMSILVSAVVAFAIAFLSSSQPGSALNLNRIVAIENRKEASFYVETSDSNYAFAIDQLKKDSRDWKAVSVNKNEAFFVKTDNSTVRTQLDKLEEADRDLISELRSEFTQNLVHLRGNYYYFLDRSMRAHFKGPRPQSNQIPSPAPPAPLPPAPQLGQQRFIPFNHVMATPQQQPQRRPKRQTPMAPIPIAPGPASTNYINLSKSNLNASLDGDIYTFQPDGTIRDILSTTVSVSNRLGLSIIYRDEHYFSYKDTPGFGLEINRLFIANGFAFFAFRDGTILTKPIGLSDAAESELVSVARKQVREICRWQGIPIDFQANERLPVEPLHLASG